MSLFQYKHFFIRNMYAIMIINVVFLLYIQSLFDILLSSSYFFNKNQNHYFLCTIALVVKW